MPANCKSRFGRFCDIYCTVILLCVTCHYILWSSSGFWRLWAKRHSWRAGEVIRCVYMYTVTVQNTWSVARQQFTYLSRFLWLPSPTPTRDYFFPREPLDQSEISALPESELKRFSWALGPLPSCVSIARSIPSCAYYFQAPVLHEA